MKTYTLSCADSFKHAPEHPERTAKRQMTGMNFDVVYQVWPSRAAMMKTIELQDKRAPRMTDWKACKIPSTHTPQWRLDIAMMVEALEKTRPSFASMKGYPAHEAILIAVDEAIKLGKQYAHK